MKKMAKMKAPKAASAGRDTAKKMSKGAAGTEKLRESRRDQPRGGKKEKSSY